MPSDGTVLIEDLDIPGYGADEVGFIEETIILAKPSFVADWGTNRGSSSRIFWELSRLHSLDPIIVTVDLPALASGLDRDHAGSATGLFIEGLDVQQLRGDGVTESLTMYVHYGRPVHAIFFVDGDHSFHNVYRELVYIHKIAPSAVVILHDTRFDPGQAIAEFLRYHPSSYQDEFLASQAGMTRLVPC